MTLRPDGYVFPAVHEYIARQSKDQGMEPAQEFYRLCRTISKLKQSAPEQLFLAAWLYNPANQYQIRLLPQHRVRRPSWVTDRKRDYDLDFFTSAMDYFRNYTPAIKYEYLEVLERSIVKRFDVEIDSEEHHRTPEHGYDDARHDVVMSELGYTIIRIRPEQVARFNMDNDLHRWVNIVYGHVVEDIERIERMLEQGDHFEKELPPE